MILPLIVAALAAGAILLIFMGLAGGSPVDPVQARLTQLGTMQAKNLEELELQQPFMERTLRPLVARMSGRVSRVTSSSFSERTGKRLAMAGNPGDLGVTDWLGIKGLGAVVGAILFFLLFTFVLSDGTVGGLAMGALGGVLRLPRAGVLAGPQDQGATEGHPADDPRHAGPADDLRPGRPWLRRRPGRVVEKLKGPLSDEFRRALAEVRVGKARRDALRDIVPRTEVTPLTNFIGAIIQAEQLGVSISKVLQVQSEQLRIERRQRAEEMAAKAPIKMLFPLVGCIFPSLFIVILGPAVILIMTNLKT